MPKPLGYYLHLSDQAMLNELDDLPPMHKTLIAHHTLTLLLTNNSPTGVAMAALVILKASELYPDYHELVESRSQFGLLRLASALLTQVAETADGGEPF